MENRIVWFFVFLVIGMAIVWVIGSFVTFDPLWFIHSVVGRVVGLLFFIASLSGAIEESNKM